MIDPALMPLGATPFRLPNPALTPMGHAWNSPAWQSLPTEVGARLLNAALFRNGEQGGYWPADPRYWYEDSAGTTVVSVGGVCGLWLDALRGLEVGNNVVTNPDFSNGLTGWTVNNADATHTITPESGGVRYLSDTTSPALQLFTVISTGHQKYVIDVDFVSGSLKTDYSGVGDIYISNKITTGYMYRTTGQLFIYRNGSNINALIRNVAFYPIASYFAIQPTTGNKPIVRVTPQTGKYWLDGNTSTAAMTVTFPSSLGSACTIARVTPEGVTFAEGQTITSTYNLTPPYGFGSDVMIINRALTAAEKALVTKVFRRNQPMLGNELVVNGAFDTDTSGWTVNAAGSISVVIGALRTENISGEATSGTTVSTATGQQLRLNYTLTKYIANSQLRAGTSFAGTQNMTNGTAGENKTAFVASGATTHVCVNQNSSVIGYYTDIDNVSIKAIL